MVMMGTGGVAGGSAEAPLALHPRIAAHRAGTPCRTPEFPLCALPGSAHARTTAYRATMNSIEDETLAGVLATACDRAADKDLQGVASVASELRELTDRGDEPLRGLALRAFPMLAECEPPGTVWRPRHIAKSIEFYDGGEFDSAASVLARRLDPSIAFSDRQELAGHWLEGCRQFDANVTRVHRHPLLESTTRFAR